MPKKISDRVKLLAIRKKCGSPESKKDGTIRAIIRKFFGRQGFIKWVRRIWRNSDTENKTEK